MPGNPAPNVLRSPFIAAPGDICSRRCCMPRKVWMIHYVENGEYVWRPLTQERVDAVRARARNPRKTKKGAQFRPVWHATN